MTKRKILHNTGENRFETMESGYTAYLGYQPYDGGLNLRVTFVPATVEGRGIGSELTAYVLDYCRDNGLSVIPTCPFIKYYIQHHPEYRSLVTD